jgi:hypothetical protein
MVSNPRILMKSMLGTLMAAILGCFCGCGSSSGSSSTLSQANANTFASQSSSAAASAMAASLAVRTPDCNPSSCMISLTINSTDTCPTGGTIVTNGTITGDFTGGAGTVQVQATETITNWACVSGYVINGNPNLAISGTFNYADFVPTGSQTMTVTGGFDWGSASNQSCTLNLTTALNTTTDSGTTTGTACGQTVNTTFQFQ